MVNKLINSKLGNSFTLQFDRKKMIQLLVCQSHQT